MFPTAKAGNFRDLTVSTPKLDLRGCMMKKFMILAASLVALVPAAVQAQDADAATEEVKDFDIGVTITGVSDYRFRGISLSDKDPAIQGAIDVEHKSGFYVGTWASTIKGSPADVEVDLYGGWRGEVGSGVNLDIGAVTYLYPGASDLDYVELLGSISYTLGPVETKLGIGYTPSQDNLGNQDNIYGYLDASGAIPGTPVTVLAHVGHEDGSLAGATGKKWDWSLGAEVVVDRFTLGLSYVDTDINRLNDPSRVANAGVVASVKVEF
jgi:uncharacterized protein (TIGR02001 family)